MAYRQQNERVRTRRGLHRGWPRVRISRDHRILDVRRNSASRHARRVCGEAGSRPQQRGVGAGCSGRGGQECRRLLALLLLSPARRRWRIIVGLDILAAAVLCLWGVANVLVGAVVLSGAVERSDIDRHALRWHVFLWDAWFLVWGLAIALAVAGAIRASHLDRTRFAPPL